MNKRSLILLIMVIFAFASYSIWARAVPDDSVVVLSNSDTNENAENSRPIGGAVFTLHGNIWSAATWGYCPIRIEDYGGSWPGLLFYADLSCYPNTNYKIHLNIEIEDPMDFIFDIGNSPTNDGGCGDYGTFSNDSEINFVDSDIYNGRPDRTFLLKICPNDYEPMRPLVTKRYYDLNDMNWSIFIQPHKLDYKFDSSDSCSYDIGFIRSSYIFNLGGPDDEAGRNDYIYWFAFNRCINGYYRKGLGVTRVRITFY